jgi:hypothetical protein
MADKTKVKIQASSYNRIFAKPKYKEFKDKRKSTMTDEELIALREMLHITPNDKNKPYRGGTTPKPL